MNAPRVYDRRKSPKARRHTRQIVILWGDLKKHAFVWTNCGWIASKALQS